MTVKHEIRMARDVKKIKSKLDAIGHNHKIFGFNRLNVYKDKDGEIISYKIHDLMHDIAQEVAREKIAHEADFIPSSLNNKIQHLSHRGFSTDSKINSFGGNKKLPFFTIAEIASDKKWRQFIDHQEEIKALKNIKGNWFVQIYIPAKAKYAMENGRKGEFLSQHLTKIDIKFAEKDVPSSARKTT
ncbi:hypothetical protein Cgig2_007720 [Carnegiea gigantea]|uniref:Uncharacterized protein n=1 Tax=Carnegiea gigantea TaxID=171969 RepID=A0A9Q1K8K7_9CARY|nr:hypothetical protein Cgig2_007720 [Carnegiea gigantea]